MRSGKLRHHLVLQTDTASSTDFGTRGENTPTWAKKYDMHCSIEQLTGQEAVLAHQLHPLATHKIRTRWREGVTVRDRLRFTRSGTTRTFGIERLMNMDERNIELEFLVREEL